MLIFERSLRLENHRLEDYLDYLLLASFEPGESLKHGFSSNKLNTDEVKRFVIGTTSSIGPPPPEILMNCDNLSFFVLYLQGNYYFRINNFNKAIISYLKTSWARNESPVSIYYYRQFLGWLRSSIGYSVLNNLGFAYLQNNEHEKAVIVFTKIINADPDYAKKEYTRAHFGRGWAYAEQEKPDYDKAIADFQVCLEANPGDVEARNNIGVVYFKQGKYSEAKGEFNKAIEKAPHYVVAYHNRAKANEKLFLMADAEKDFNEAVRLAKNDHRFYFGRGESYLSRKKELQQAYIDLATAYELMSENIAPEIKNQYESKRNEAKNLLTEQGKTLPKLPNRERFALREEAEQLDIKLQERTEQFRVEQERQLLTLLNTKFEDKDEKIEQFHIVQEQQQELLVSFNKKFNEQAEQLRVLEARIESLSQTHQLQPLPSNPEKPILQPPEPTSPANSLPITNLVLEGGGVKGLGYLGALQRMEEKGFELSQLDRVVGTSVGAITALLISLNYSLGEIEDELSQLDFVSLLDGDFKKIQELKDIIRDVHAYAQSDMPFFKQLLWDSVGFLSALAFGAAVPWLFGSYMGVLLGRLLGAMVMLTSSFFIFKNFYQRSESPTRMLYRMISERHLLGDKEAICEGEIALKWLQDKIAAKTGSPHTSFRQLHDMKLNGKPFKDLFVIAFNLDLKRPETFSYHNELLKEASMACAVLASMSLPKVFPPMHCLSKKGYYHYIDGGVAKNYPLHEFDPFSPWKATLGLRLDTKEEIDTLLERHSNGPKPSNINQDAWNLLTILSEIYVNEQNHMHLEEDNHRTIFIDTKNVDTLDFSLPLSKKMNLITSGKLAVIDFCEREPKHVLCIQKFSTQRCLTALGFDGSEESVTSSAARSPQPFFFLWLVPFMQLSHDWQWASWFNDEPCDALVPYQVPKETVPQTTWQCVESFQTDWEGNIVSPRLVCFDEHSTVYVFPKENASLRDSCNNERCNYQYDVETCRPVEYEGKASIFCEGDTTTKIETLHPWPSYNVDGNLMLGAVFFYLGQQTYRWVTQKEKKKPEAPQKMAATNATARLNTLQEKLLVIKQNIKKLNQQGDHSNDFTLKEHEEALKNLVRCQQNSGFIAEHVLQEREADMAYFGNEVVLDIEAFSNGTHVSAKSNQTAFPKTKPQAPVRQGWFSMFKLNYYFQPPSNKNNAPTCIYKPC